MSSTHEGMHELLGLYVLGAVAPAEVTEFEAHLAVCEACRAEVAALRPVVAGLARTVPQVDPPAGLRERVIRTATGRRVSRSVLSRTLEVSGRPPVGAGRLAG